MDLDSIERFIAVFDRGSFASAARTLDITPQALSTSIVKLENSLGIVLFDRERGGVTKPTRLGESFLPHARFLMATRDSAIDEMRARRDGDSGWLRFGIGESLDGATAAVAISELRAETPNARIAVVEGYTSDLLDRLQRGELDLVAGAPDSERLEQRDFAQDYLYPTADILVVRRGHPLAGRKNVTLAAMRKFPWMLPHSRPDNYEVMVAAFVAAKQRVPDDVIYCDSATLRKELLADSDCILFISRDVFWPRLGDPASPFVILDARSPRIERHACLVYRADAPLNPLAVRLRERIIAQAGTAPRP